MNRGKFCRPIDGPKNGIYVLYLRVNVGTEVVIMYCTWCFRIKMPELIYALISTELMMPRNEELQMWH